MAFLDNFNGEASNIDLASHTPSGGTAWTRLDGVADYAQVSASTNRLINNTTNTSGALYVCDDQGTADHYTQYTCQNAAIQAYVAHRATDRDNWVGVRVFNNKLQIWRRVGGVLTQMGGDSATSVVSGDTIRFESSGTTHTAYINGAQAVQTTDSTNSTVTRQGVVPRSSGAVAWLDNYEAGSLATISQVNTTSTVRWSLLNSAGRSDALRWNGVQSATLSHAARWDTLVVAQAQMLSHWDLITGVEKALSTGWDLLKTAGETVVLRWDTQSAKTAVGLDATLRWSQVQAVGAALAARWDASGLVGVSRPLRWSAVQTAAAAITARWDLSDLLAVGAGLTVRWDARATAGGNKVFRWTIGDTAARTYGSVDVLVLPAENTVFLLEPDNNVLIIEADRAVLVIGSDFDIPNTIH